MNILEDLKRQAREQLRQSGEDVADRRPQDLSVANTISALHRIHEYLQELLEVLYLTEQEPEIGFSIAEGCVLSKLHRQQYNLNLERKDGKLVLTLSFDLHVNEALKIDYQGDVQALIAELSTQSLSGFSINTDKTLEFNGDIPVSLQFTMEKDSTDVRLLCNNLGRPGKTSYSIPSSLIDEDLLNELGGLVLQRENLFVKRLQQIPTPAAPARKGEPDPLTKEMDVSRFQNLLNRDQRLYLTYRNAIKELNGRNADFMIGRSSGCDMVVKSDLASRNHAHIIFRKGKFILADQSTNGTFIKRQGGKEVYLQGEEYPLSGSGFISLGKSVSVDNEHLIYFSCQ